MMSRIFLIQKTDLDLEMLRDTEREDFCGDLVKKSLTFATATHQNEIKMRYVFYFEYQQMIQ